MKRIKLLFVGAMACAALSGMTHAYAQANGIGRGIGTGIHLGNIQNTEGITRVLLGMLHARLAITAAQESAWQSFANAVIAEAADADTQILHPAATANAVDTVNARAAALRRQADDAAAVAQSFAALYAVLAPAQRALVDDYLKFGGLL